MKLIFDFLLLTAAITKCQATLGNRFCFEACPYFTIKNPKAKINLEAVKKECKKAPWALRGTCNEISTMDEQTRKEAEKDTKNLTWLQACRKYCH